MSRSLANLSLVAAITTSLSIAILSPSAFTSASAGTTPFGAQSSAAPQATHIASRARLADRFKAPRCNATNPVISRDGRYLFADDLFGDRAFLCVIDLRQQKVVKRLLLRTSKEAHTGTLSLSRDGRFLYVEVGDAERHPILGVSFAYSSIVTVDTQTFEVVQTFTPKNLAPAGYEEGMAIFGLTNLVDDTVLYSVHGSGKHGYLLFADLASRSWDLLSRRVPNDINNMVVSADGRTLWALGDRLDRMDTLTWKTEATSSDVGGTFPKISESSLALSPDERTLHMVDSSRRLYMVLDAQSLRVRKTVRLSVIPEALAMSPDGERIWILVSDPLPSRPPSWPPPEEPDEVWTFDTQGRKTGQFALPGPGSAESLVFSPQGERAYATFRRYPGPAEVLILDAR